ncbi:MAG TPA: protein O-GlcNAcase [Trueperaceae bacterium]
MSPFELRGVIEGFYGVFYTQPQRLSLLEFMGRHGFNLYIYAPKNDRQHRRHWREPYPPRQLEQFREAAAVANSQGIDFCYALSPGIDICYSSEEEFAAVLGKLETINALGVSHFSLLLDDIRPTFANERDAEAYPSVAAAQAHLCNRALERLREIDPNCRLSMCPTDYHGGPPFSPAVAELGELLDPAIDVFYTGLDVCSREVGRSEVDEFARVVRRRPLIWDNYPVNDLAMQGELHVGPIRGRSADLHRAARGVVVNPMNQMEASKVPLATYAEYLADPARYRPEEAWARALREVAERHARELELIARNSLRSCLGTEEAERLAQLTASALVALEAGLADDPVVGELHAYLTELDEACYALRYRLENLELRNELLPWLEQLEQWTWLGRWSIEALSENAVGSTTDAGRLRRIEEWQGMIERHPKRIGGEFLRPLAQLALERCLEAEAA